MRYFKKKALNPNIEKRNRWSIIVTKIVLAKAVGAWALDGQANTKT